MKLLVVVLSSALFFINSNAMGQYEESAKNSCKNLLAIVTNANLDNTCKYNGVIDDDSLGSKSCKEGHVRVVHNSTFNFSQSAIIIFGFESKGVVDCVFIIDCEEYATVITISQDRCNSAVAGDVAPKKQKHCEIKHKFQSTDDIPGMMLIRCP